MAKLLYIEASPRKARSASIQVARAFLDAYRAAHPADQVETLDLWQTPLPELDETLINARYALIQGEGHSSEQAAAWARVAMLAERFKSADKYLFSLPMWNFGIPYKLKHLIDAITHPGLTFSFAPETGYQGLVTGKPAVVVYARGGEYPAGSPAEGYDLQKRYFEQWLGFIGITAVQAVVVEPTLAAGPEGAERAKAAASQKAAGMARGF